MIDGFERGYLAELLRVHGGNLAAAARAAGMDRKNLWALAVRHGLRWSSLSAGCQTANGERDVRQRRRPQHVAISQHGDTRVAAGRAIRAARVHVHLAVLGVDDPVLGDAGLGVQLGHFVPRS